MTDEPRRHARPVASIGTTDKQSNPVCVVVTPLANRFAGLAVIGDELATACEMVARIGPEDDRFLREALWRAAVSIYTRCFSASTKGMPKLEMNDHLDGAAPELRALHTALISVRHNFLSHAGRSDLEQSSAHVVLSNPTNGKKIEALIAVRSARTDPPMLEVDLFAQLLRLVRQNAQRSMKLAHDTAKAEVENMDIEALYARCQRLPDA